MQYPLGDCPAATFRRSYDLLSQVKSQFFDYFYSIFDRFEIDSHFLYLENICVKRTQPRRYIDTCKFVNVSDGGSIF